MPSASRRTPHISRLQLPKNVSSEVAIVVPTHPLHFGKVVDLLRSTKRNVRSMQRVLTLLVVSSGNEKPQLARVLKQHSALYWWVRIASLQEASACGYSLLAKREEGAFDLLAANGIGLGFDKFVLQSSKKTLGAMCVPQRHVLMLDSESLFVRRVDLEAEVRALGSAEAWPILYDAPSAGSAAWQNAGSTTRIAAASLVAEVAKRLCARAVGGLRCEPWDSSAETGRMYGFSLGYFWLFPTAVVRGFVGALRRAYGSYWHAMEAVGARPGKWFGELALYVFMLHIHTGRRRYAAVDAQGLLRRHVPDCAPPRRTLRLVLALAFTMTLTLTLTSGGQPHRASLGRYPAAACRRPVQHVQRQTLTLALAPTLTLILILTLIIALTLALTLTLAPTLTLTLTRYSAKPMRGAMPAWRVKPDRGSGADSDASMFGRAKPHTHFELLQRCKPIYLVRVRVRVRV